MLVPRAPRPGSTCAVLTLSWGGPQAYPAAFERGLDLLRSEFGWTIREYPSTRQTAAWLDAHPEDRVRDLHAAFADPTVDLIVASIGGSDAVRLLPLLDLDLILANPKPILGHSDATAYLSWLAQNGLVTYYANSVMSGFAQLAAFDDALEWHRQAFAGAPVSLKPFRRWTHGGRDWTEGKVEGFETNAGFTWVQGTRATRGVLWGGCFEVLEMMKGSRFWPQPDFWSGKVLFLETSEEKPLPRQVLYWLRNYGLQGVFSQLSALWIGRPKDYTSDQRAELRRIVQGVVAEEWGATELPIVTDLDFGHTDPRWIVPLGAVAITDPLSGTVSLETPLFT